MWLRVVSMRFTASVSSGVIWKSSGTLPGTDPGRLLRRFFAFFFLEPSSGDNVIGISSFLRENLGEPFCRSLDRPGGASSTQSIKVRSNIQTVLLHLDGE